MSDHRYRHRSILNAYVAAEIELIIGLVTTALIVIFQRDLWLALGTLVAFVILEFIIVTVIETAEDAAQTRAQVEELTAAQREGRLPEPIEDPLADLDDPWHWWRVAGITVAVTVGIVVVRSLIG